MRHHLLTLGLSLAISSAACAAPTTDEEGSATDQASSVDEAVVRTAEMKKSLTSARLEIKTTLRFEKGAVWVGTANSTGCLLRLSPSTKQDIPTVPKGDVYLVDASAIRLERAEGYLTWMIPLNNEETENGARGARADITLECSGISESRTAPTALSIKHTIGFVTNVPTSRATLITPNM